MDGESAKSAVDYKQGRSPLSCFAPPAGLLTSTVGGTYVKTLELLGARRIIKMSTRYAIVQNIIHADYRKFT